MFIPFEKKFNGSVNLDVVNLVDENDETGLSLMTDYRGPSLLLFSMFESRWKSSSWIRKFAC